MKQDLYEWGIFHHHLKIPFMQTIEYFHTFLSALGCLYYKNSNKSRTIECDLKSTLWGISLVE